MAYGARSRFEATDTDEDLRQAMGLALAAAGGDARATAALLGLVAPAVMRAVRMVLGDKSPERDDVNQQAMLNVVRSLDGFRGDCHPAGYAARVAIHTALSARRSARTNRLAYCDPLELPELPINPRGDDAFAAYRKHLLREILRQLPPEQAEIVGLHVVLGHSLSEVAAITCTALNTVKSRLRLAKTLMRRHLGETSEIGSEDAEGPGAA